jgi:Fe-S-cluster containining protein
MGIVRNMKRRAFAANQGAARARANAALRQLHVDVDKRHEEPFAVDGKVVPTSCTRGCSACCRQVVLIELLEAEYIIERHRSTVVRALPVLREHARLADAMPGGWQTPEDERIAARAYWQANIPCAFLTPAGECSIYRDRPIACRTHFVTSDPALCGTEDPSIVGVADFGTRSGAPTRVLRIAAEMRSGGGKDSFVLPGTLPQLIVHAWDRRRAR